MDFLLQYIPEASIIILFTFLIALVILAIYKDHFTAKPEKFHSLNDSESIFDNKYVIQISTGIRSKQASNIDIRIQLVGFKRNSFIYNLRELTRGSVNNYVIHELNPLGRIHSIRVYSKMKNSLDATLKPAQWFIRFIKVFDLVDNQKHDFIIYKWIVGDRSNSKWSLNEFKASHPSDSKSVGHLFLSNFERILIDSSPWISLHFRSYYSDITYLARAQMLIFTFGFITILDYYIRLNKSLESYLEDIQLIICLSVVVLSVLSQTFIWFIFVRLYAKLSHYSLEKSYKSRIVNMEREVAIIDLSPEERKRQYEECLNKLIEEMKTFKKERQPPKLVHKATVPMLKLNSIEVLDSNVDNTEPEEYVATRKNTNLLAESFANDVYSKALFVAPKLEGKKFSRLYSIFTFITEFYDLSLNSRRATMFDSAENHQDLETGKKVENFFTEKLTFPNGDEKNISYFKFILANSAVALIHGLIICLLVKSLWIYYELFTNRKPDSDSDNIYSIILSTWFQMFLAPFSHVFIVFAYSVFNAIYFEYENNDKSLFPAYIKIYKKLTSFVSSNLNSNDIILIEQDQINSIDSDEDEDEDEGEKSLVDTKSLHHLEKEFMRAIVKIIPYLLFVAIMHSIASKSSYGQQRLESNEDLRDWFQETTKWNSVNSHCSMLKWSIDEIKNIIDMKSAENCNNIKPLYVRLHNSNFLLFKSIRLAYIGKSNVEVNLLEIDKRLLLTEHNTMGEFQSGKNFFGYTTSGDETLSMEGIKVLIIDYESLIKDYSYDWGTKCEDYYEDVQYFSLEVNLYDEMRNFWTVLKATTETIVDENNNDKESIVKSFSMRNVRNEMLKLSPQKTNYNLINTLIYFLSLSAFLLYEKRELNQKKKILSWEGIVDLMLFATTLIYLMTLLYAQTVHIPLISDIGIDEVPFFSLDSSHTLERTLQAETNLMLCAAFLKALDLLKLNPKTYLITDTIRLGCADLFVFILFVLANYVFFGLWAYVMFNPQLDPQFATIKRSIYYSIISFVQHIDFSLLVETRFGSLVVWQAVMYFYAQRVLVNFVAAVIIHYFHEVQKNHKRTKTEKVFTRIKRSIWRYFNFFSSNSNNNN